MPAPASLPQDLRPPRRRTSAARARLLRTAVATFVALVAVPVAGAHGAPGDLDPGWGTQGVVRASDADGAGVVVAADGRVLVADRQGTIRRYLADGRPDTTFGAGGVVEVTGEPAGIALDAQGRIVVGGRRFVAAAGEEQLWVARYAPDGTPDATFGAGTGEVVVPDPAGGDVFAQGFAATATGFVVVGSDLGSTRLEVARVTAAGVPDPAFGTGGFAALDAGSAFQDARAVVVQASGRIVVGGADDVGGLLVGVTPTGTIDPTFGTGGVRHLGGASGGADALALAPDGRIVVGGYQGDALLVGRFSATGAPDPTCGGAGTVAIDLGAASQTARAVAVLPGGKLVAAGDAGDALAVVRLDADCSLDPGFSGDGKATSLAGQGARAQAIALQADGRALVAGVRAADTNTLYVLRYLGGEPPVVTPPVTTPTTPTTTTTPPATTPTTTTTPPATTQAVPPGVVPPALPVPDPCAADHVAPRIAITSLQGTTRYAVGAPASVRIAATDAGGLAVDPSVASRRLSTARPGSFVVRADARDRCGTPAQAVFRYRVVRPPSVGVQGVRAACVTRDFRVRIRVRSSVGVQRVVVSRGGRVLLRTRTASPTLVVHAARLPRGRHVLEVRATDRAGNVTTSRSTFARCATVQPTFTG